MYNSPLTSKKFFVGVLDTEVNCFNVVANKTTLTGTKTFLDIERRLTIDDPKCRDCSKVNDCRLCKNIRKPASITELLEGEKLENSIHVIPNSESPPNKKILVEYQFKEDIKPEEIYPPLDVNKSPAKKASMNLYNKLKKET